MTQGKPKHSGLVELKPQPVEGPFGEKKLPDGSTRPRGVPTSTFWEFVEFSDHGDRDRIFGPFPGEVNEFSQVAASLTEIHPVSREPFLGLASLLVYNVVPDKHGRIRVRMGIGWHENILLRINFIIVN